MSGREIALMRELQIAASQMGARLFRQNAGVGWIGRAEKFARAKSVMVQPGDVLIRQGRPFHAGHEGLSDLGGWSPVTITPEMVGQTLAVFAQVEVKAGARTTDAQRKWIAAVNAAGGLAGIARDDVGLREILTAKSGSTE